MFHGKYIFLTKMLHGYSFNSPNYILIDDINIRIKCVEFDKSNLQRVKFQLIKLSVKL